MRKLRKLRTMILLRCSPRVEKRERLQIELRLHLRPHIAKWASLSSSLSSSTSSSLSPSSSSSSSCFLYVHIGPDIAKWARPVCSSFPHNNQFLNIKYKKNQETNYPNGHRFHQCQGIQLLIGRCFVVF